MNDYNNFENKIGRYFWLEEFLCPCCNTIGMGIDERLIKVLDAMRAELNAPIHVSSGFRCELHNKVVGGAPLSQHLYGRAADIWIDNKDIPTYALGWLAAASGADGIGIYHDYIHVDTRGYRARW